MTHHWDEFSKSLAEESVSRRESLRRLGFALVGTVLSPLGVQTASAAGRQTQSDPCKTFCKCRNSKQQDQCLKTCNACGKNPSRLAGRCGGYVCCGAGQTSCGNYCANLANDPDNCGACGYLCEEPGPYEYGACINGRCEYDCVEGAVYCNGICTFLDADPDNCGACGRVCPDSAPYCNNGRCICPAGMAVCNGKCVDISNDPDNCGACGHVCGGSTPYCSEGGCTYCGGYGVAVCNGVCVYIDSDNNNCGACGVQCGTGEQCTGGICLGSCSGCY